MNIEEIDKWLNNEYGVSYTRLEELHDIFFEKYTNYKCILTELEEWLKEIMKIYKKDVFDIVSNAIYNQCEDTLDKIQELKEKYK